MSLKSDRWIREQCEPVTYLVTTRDGYAAFCEDFYVNEYNMKAKILEKRNLELDDDFIKNFVKETGQVSFTLASVKIVKLQEPPKRMITPFVGESVKTNEAGERIPSYGLTSFGYDIRLGRNLKLFKRHIDLYTAEQNFIVETKKNGCIYTEEQKDYDGHFIDACNFDPNCYQEYNDVDYIVLPPQGFLLGHTVEHFNMPKDTLGICVGKSTHARTGISVLVTPLEPGWCFTGDTEVALVNGESLTFVELEKRYNDGERFFGYTITNSGEIRVEELLNIRKTKHNAELVKVTLDNGETIRCTPDHKFMVKNNASILNNEYCYIEASKLSPGTSLMPLYRYYDKKGYESVASPIYNKSRPIYTHKLSDDWNIRNKIYEVIPNTVRHHIDFTNTNNNPTNITRLSDEEHHRIHETKEGYAEERSKIGKHGWNKFVEYLGDSMNVKQIISEIFSKRSNSFWKDQEHAETREKWLAANKDPRPYRYKYFNENEIWNSFKELGSISATAKKLKTKAETIVRRFPSLVANARDQGFLPINHKVVSVEYLTEKEDVYCLSVPDTNNFALGAGVFVHNCGYLTVEISNLSNVPVKLITGSGIAQINFFKSDEQCEINYSDRGGKYQGQPAIPVDPK